MNRTDTLLLFAVVHERWPNWHLPVDDARLDARVMAWDDVIGDLDVAEVRAALAAMPPREFAPDPALVRETVFRLRGGGAPEVDDALAEVFAAISRHGWTETPEWSHPAIGAAVRAVGGWLEVCRSENPPALRAHLAKMYGTAAARQEREAIMPPAVAAILGRVGKPMELEG